jgi:AcrR family transcriptional regulator
MPHRASSGRPFSFPLDKTNDRANFSTVGKGELTRHAILEKATALASRVGLGGLTIGDLAAELDLSKSGLFAHFRSKEALQVQVLEHAAERFVEAVVRPALGQPRGEPRVRALFEGWVAWERSRPLPGGCVFVAASSELDDRPGPVRVRLVHIQRDWLEAIANCFRTGIREGHFRPGADPEQFAQDLYGVMLAFHHASRLMGDPAAGSRARAAFEALLTAARSPRAARGVRAAR